MQTATETASPVCEQAGGEAIGLALRSDVRLKDRVRSRYDTPVSLLRYAVIYIAIAALLRFVPGLNTVSFDAFAMGVGVVIVLTILIARAIKKRSHPVSPSPAPEPGALMIHESPTREHRVWCVGTREELNTMDSRLVERDDGFEPIVYTIWTPPDGSIFGTAALLLSVACAAALYAVITYGFAQTFPAFWAILFGISCGPVVTAWLFRRYTRITPGAVEVLNIGFLGFGRAAVERVDLRRARVIADLTQQCVFVIQPNGAHATIELLDDERRIEIASDILRAAVSTAIVPDLPEDALVG